MTTYASYASQQVDDVSDKLQSLLDTHINGDGRQFGCVTCQDAIDNGEGLCLTGQILAVTRMQIEYSHDHGTRIPRQRSHPA